MLKIYGQKNVSFPNAEATAILMYWFINLMTPEKSMCLVPNIRLLQLSHSAPCMEKIIATHFQKCQVHRQANKLGSVWRALPICSYEKGLFISLCRKDGWGVNNAQCSFTSSVPSTRVGRLIMLEHTHTKLIKCLKKLIILPNSRLGKNTLKTTDLTLALSYVYLMFSLCFHFFSLVLK